MQTPAIDTATAPAAAANRSPADRPVATARPLAHWSCLPLQRLNNFELIHHQFAAQHIWFDSAIALRPSNPAFQTDESVLTLMPYACDHSLKVQLGRAIDEVDFGYMGSAALTISCLDDQGHCVAIVKTAENSSPPQLPEAEPSRHEIQGITLNTSSARTLRIHSTAPFVLTRFWVKAQGHA